jgi:DNA-binding response OmpR family regulator
MSFKPAAGKENMIKQARQSVAVVGHQPSCRQWQRPQRLDLQRETILVVEDSLDLQKLIRLFLEAAGYAVITASDGEEGLQIYEQFKSNIGMVVTDVAMPKMSGLELADRILGYDSKLPVLVMSGELQNSFGSFEFIAKPFSPPELVGRVGKVLNAYENRRERERV